MEAAPIGSESDTGRADDDADRLLPELVFVGFDHGVEPRLVVVARQDDFDTLGRLADDPAGDRIAPLSPRSVTVRPSGKRDVNSRARKCAQAFSLTPSRLPTMRPNSNSAICLGRCVP